MSQKKHSQIPAANGSRKTTVMTGLYVFIFCLIFIALGLGEFLFAYFSFFEHFLKERTNGIEYIFYGSDWFSSGIPAFLAAIGIAGCIMNKMMRYFPRANAMMNQQYLSNMTRSLGRQDAQNLAVQLDQIESKGWVAKFTWLMIIITIPFMVLDALNFRMVTKEGVIQRTYASFHTTENSWDDIARVETGCYSFPRGGLMLRYSLVFNNGSYINLFDLEPNNTQTSQMAVVDRILRQGKTGFPIQDNIDQIEIVDNTLKKLGKPFSIEKFKFSIHLGEPYLNMACISKLRIRYPDKYTRIIKLLHLEKMGGLPTSSQEPQP